MMASPSTGDLPVGVERPGPPTRDGRREAASMWNFLFPGAVKLNVTPTKATTGFICTMSTDHKDIDY